MGNYLLDTHALIWSLSEPGKLKPSARKVIEDGRSSLFVSMATLWEMYIKAAVERLKIPPELDAHLEMNAFGILNIEHSHVKMIQHLPLLHGDPFDRMLVVQAQYEDLTIITRDRNVRQYDVPVLDA